MRLFVRLPASRLCNAPARIGRSSFSTTSMPADELQKLLREAGCSETEVAGWGKEMHDWPVQNVR